MSRFSMIALALCLALWISTIVPILQRASHMDSVGQMGMAAEAAGAAFATTILFFLAVAVKSVVLFTWRSLFPPKPDCPF